MGRKKTYKNLRDKIAVYYTDCSSLNDDKIFTKLYNQLPQNRKRKVDDFVFDKDKFLCCAAWNILKIALEDYNVNINNLEVLYKEYEKPYFKNSPLKFNLSHSGTMALCALSLEEIGCDVETVKAYEEGLAKYCLTKNELSYIENAKGTINIDSLFYDYWTIKESLIKYLGLGLNLDPRYIDIKLNEDMEKSNVKITETSLSKIKGINIYKFCPNKNYSWACCDCGSKKELTIKEIKFT